ncbi:hypothetical protein BBD42_13755 [Paenibacillus sp. BIHB 4019]|uniref:Enoyl-CoA hydratase n=1 Tax=Paenibacillus sp. BIHB 4019 TaxID=1870819 RepID=A0A1B2DI72_9BACL|nr:enoyl-CoA hydratase/isomerase family protein [Paenibacillus sp. BIHB 4019]ANY67422.1 hypothetical protein BBD42_13755 [Paenibacillus sp. BIHB 4019]
MSANPGIEFHKEGRIGIIRFNNPPLNLGTNNGLALLEKILADIESDGELRVVVLTHNGKVFSAGSDMNEIQQHLDKDTYVSDKMEGEIRLRTRLSVLPIPTIAALDGSAYGGGFDWALSCDMRVAAPHVVLSLPEVNIGSFPGSGSAYRITRLIGAGRAMQFMLFAKPMTAQEALSLGVVNEIANEGTAYELAYRWAEEIAAKSGSAVRAVKEALTRIYMPEQSWLDLTQLDISQKVAESEDFKEGMQAFFEKRPPVFAGDAVQKV